MKTQQTIIVRDVSRENERARMFNALELGFQCAEKGLNLEASRLELDRILLSTNPHKQSTPINYDN